MDLKIVCKFCKGAKKLYGEGPCPFCEGRGNETVVAPNEGYHYAVDICERIVYTEFEELTEEECLYLAAVLGAGHVNLKTGSMERENMRAMFPAGTATNANLSALIGEAL